MPYQLGKKSIENLGYVHPNIVHIVSEAIKISEQDFGVFEGVRSLEKEQDLINKGASKLTDPRHCKHCIQPDNYGHAVDLVPWIDGAYAWDWVGIYKIAAAVRTCAIKFNTPLRWGGVWDRTIGALSSDMKLEVEKYEQRHPGADFIDGPHYEIP